MIIYSIGHIYEEVITSTQDDCVNFNKSNDIQLH